MAEPLDTAAALAKLREPFLPNQISKLPKPYKKDSPKGKCGECGGYHGLPAVHLDYVGHAALTDRLLECDPAWFWEPVAFNSDGLPATDRNGGLWIRLTVAGVTRLGYGDADGKSGGNAVKEAIGDALRNAAMRFGAALDLWHKGELHVNDQADDAESAHERLQKQQQQESDSSGPADWARDQIATWNGYNLVDAKKATTHADHPEYQRLMAELRKADQRLWTQVKTAQDAALLRCEDDVPY